MYRLHHIGFAAICLFATADADQSRSPMAEFGHVEKRFAAFVPQAANDACVVIDVNADETPVGRLIFGEAAYRMGVVVEKQDATRTLREYAGQLKDRPLFVTNGGNAEAVLVPLQVLDSETLAKLMKLYEQVHTAKEERAGEGPGHAERSNAADSR
jgi:hypothetical protein